LPSFKSTTQVAAAYVPSPWRRSRWRLSLGSAHVLWRSREPAVVLVRRRKATSSRGCPQRGLSSQLCTTCWHRPALLRKEQALYCCSECTAIARHTAVGRLERKAGPRLSSSGLPKVLAASKACIALCTVARRGLTPRSSGAPTAGRQARAGGTLYIVASPGLASCRRRPLSSNVRQHKLHFPRPTSSQLLPAMQMRVHGFAQQSKQSERTTAEAVALH
jgi:hypothetical protein